LGRVRADVEPRAAAALLLGGCFQHAFLSRFADTTMDDHTAERTAAGLARTLVTGLNPQP